MQVRKYHAENMKEALKLVRRDFGSQAVILSTKTAGGKIAGERTDGTKRGVEVVAALDYDFDSSAGRTKSLSQSAKSKVSSWKELLSERVSLENIQHELKELKKMMGQSHGPCEEGSKDLICMELKELKGMTQFLLRQAVPLEHHEFSEQLVHFYCQMIKQEICEEIALKLIKELKQDLSPDALRDRDQVRDNLISRIEKELPLAGPIDLTPGKVKIAALVGPTGVGKTTTVAKLAALYALNKKRKVALVTIDTYRIAAVEQLRVYSKIMGLPFANVSSPKEFGKTLAQFADRDLILVDTAGRSPRDQSQMEELKSFLRQSFPVEVHLAMSVTHKEDNLSATVNQFGLLPIDRIIFTKLDESYTYGSMVNQLVRIKKPLSFLTTGQKVPEDIEIATKKRIVSLILGERDVHYC